MTFVVQYAHYATREKRLSSRMGYTAKDIEILEGLEPVRRRPAMYIGDSGQGGLNRLAGELIGNAAFPHP